LILKGFAVDKEAAVVVEVDCAGVPVWGRLGSGSAGLLGAFGRGSRHSRPSGLCCGNGLRSFAPLRMTARRRGSRVANGRLGGMGWSWRSLLWNGRVR
jgi:hypothetical protein